MADRKLENLQIWIDSRKFVVSIYDMMSVCKDYGFKDQIQRASVSIMNNIAEGFESGSDALFIRYLKISKGSCSEVKSMLYLCEDLHYCSQPTRLQLHENLLSLTNRIYKLITYLEQKQK